MILNLPEDSWRSIAYYLTAPDVLNFLSVHRQINDILGRNSTFWCMLLSRDNGGLERIVTEDVNCDTIRRDYMVHAYKSCLRDVKWYPLRSNPQLSAREGHLSCVLWGPHKKEKRVIVTGGFTDDDDVHILHVPAERQIETEEWTWNRLCPVPRRNASFVYGASLTSLEPIVDRNGCHISRAVRFGGFMAGGYADETNEVCLLTIREELVHGNQITAAWETIPVPPEAVEPRAYHSATLIANRYLLMIGGMTSRESILNEAILDTNTWTWMNQPISTFGDGKPSGRHGHSVVLDYRRNRLVLFGGGSGTDLLRSGEDNSEVWELKMNDDWETSLKLPWAWSKIHADCTNSEDEENDEEGVIERLSTAETLCLGRCHHGLLVSPDTVILLFGSGRPSTNHVIVYNLSTDAFLRPNINGCLPKPRLSGTAVFLDAEGYIFTHGGYATDGSGAIDDCSILDLAPFLNREFESLVLDLNQSAYREITNQEAERGRLEMGTRMAGHNMLEQLDQNNFFAQVLSMAHAGMVDINEIQEWFSDREAISTWNNNGMSSESDDDDGGDSATS